MTFLLLLLVYFWGESSKEDESIYLNGFGYPCDNKLLDCLPGKCLPIIGGESLCIECKSGRVPINGNCVDNDVAIKEAGCIVSSINGRCIGCDHNHFLFYGGCYKFSSKWKTSICNKVENGICIECAKEGNGHIPIVFTNVNSESPERCIYCGDPIGFGGYSGVYNCYLCNSPRLPRKTEADCYACSNSKGVCPYDYRCKSVAKGAVEGFCSYCQKTHLWSYYSCYAVNSPTGDSICLPKHIMEISDESLCSRCTNPSEVPRDGRCTSIDGFENICIKDPESGMCTRCQNSGTIQYYLFYGGCYTYKDGIPSRICQAVENNVCTKCVSNNKEVFTKDDRCRLCGDASNGGIAGCQKCEMKNEELKCLECKGFYRSLDKKSCLATCPKGQKGILDSVTKIFACVCDSGFYLIDGDCIKCSMSNCAECDNNKCFKCQYGYTLFNDRCVLAKCRDPNCNTCRNKEVCIRCNEGYSVDPSGLCVKDCLYSAGYYKDIVNGISKCLVCTLNNCVVCASASECNKCKDGFYAGRQGRCEKCSLECATCSGPTSNDCTSCPVKKQLHYISDTKGSCAPQCVENENCAECQLLIEGTSYCSRCTRHTEYPQNGVCMDMTVSRAIMPNCINVVNGRCIACDSNSFKLKGGCYTSKLLPGKTVCIVEKDGLCEHAVRGYGVTYSGNLRGCPKNCKVCVDEFCSACNQGFFLNKGKCTVCPEGCAVCPHEQTCFDCLPGYFFSENICKACHIAIPDCVICMIPKNAMKPVCLKYKYNPPNSSLSTMAISGIGIGVLFVVGIITTILVWLLVFKRRS